MTATWEVIANWETVEIAQSADLGTKEPGNEGTGEPRDWDPRDKGTEGPGTEGPGNQEKASHEVGRVRRDLRERLQDLIVRKCQDSMSCH